MTIRCNAKGNLGPLTGSGKGSNRLAVAGFTLIEILIVIVIIYGLVRIATMAFQSYILRGQNAAAMADVRTLEIEIFGYKDAMGVFPSNLDMLSSGNKLDPWNHHYQYLDLADDPALAG